MAALDRAAILDILRHYNVNANESDLHIYADLFLDYQAALSHIQEHGLIVSHPRTGVPFENPYLKIKNNALVLLRKIRGLKTAALWNS